MTLHETCVVIVTVAACCMAVAHVVTLCYKAIFFTRAADKHFAMLRELSELHAKEIAANVEAMLVSRRNKS